MGSFRSTDRNRPGSPAMHASPARKLLRTGAALAMAGVLALTPMGTAAQAQGGIPLVRDAEAEALMRDYAGPIFDAAGIARAHMMRGALGLPGGQLVANPIPEAAEIPREDLAPVIARASRDAADHGIAGKALTPYLLQRIFELTEGRSLDANVALVLNNARLGAEIACELNTLRVSQAPASAQPL